MNTQNCLSCNKVYEGMKGKLMIVINKPKDFNVPVPIQISDAEGTIDATVATGAVYIIDVTNEINICATFGANMRSTSDYVTVLPGEFTHLEVDYEYFMYDNNYRVNKLVLKRIVHTKNSYYK